MKQSPSCGARASIAARVSPRFPVATITPLNARYRSKQPSLRRGSSEQDDASFYLHVRSGSSCSPGRCWTKKQLAPAFRSERYQVPTRHLVETDRSYHWDAGGAEEAIMRKTLVALVA